MSLSMLHDILCCLISPVAHSAHELNLVWPSTVVLVLGLEVVQHILLAIVQDLVITQSAVDPHKIPWKMTVA